MNWKLEDYDQKSFFSVRHFCFGYLKQYKNKYLAKIFQQSSKMNIPFDNSGPNTNTGATTDKVKILNGEMVNSANGVDATYSTRCK